MHVACQNNVCTHYKCIYKVLSCSVQHGNSTKYELRKESLGSNPCDSEFSDSVYLAGSPLKVSFMNLETGEMKTPEKRKQRYDHDWMPSDSAQARYHNIFILHF